MITKACIIALMHSLRVITTFSCLRDVVCVKEGMCVSRCFPAGISAKHSLTCVSMW